MRVYLPVTLPLLARWRDEGVLDPPPAAQAVTPALREWYAESDMEELEQAAFYDAERRSLRLLALDSTAPRLRIVVAADVPDDSVAPAGGTDDDQRSAVVVRAAVPLGAVVSVHVDEAAARADIVAAIEALPAAGAGDDEAQFVVDGAEGHDLLWYGVTELDDLLSDLLAPPGATGG